MKIEITHEGQDYFSITVNKKNYQVPYAVGMLVYQMMKGVQKTLKDYCTEV